MHGWIMTANGKPFYPLRPRPCDIDIKTIAHALANICRYGGHCKSFYSVAQHSVLVARQLPPELRLAGLLHDAAEAYIGDIPRPLKHDLGAWHHAERAIDEAVSLRFGLPVPMHPAVKAVDDRIILDEWAALMPPTDGDIGVCGEPLGIAIAPWLIADAERTFLECFAAWAGWTP